MSILLALFVLFATVTLAELVILFRLYQATGLATTLGVVIATAALGSFLVRRQGLIVWRKFNEELSRGEMPTDRMLDGLFLIIAGALLVTPGLITDFVGFMLIIPGNRRLLRAWLKGYIRRKMESGRIQVRVIAPGPAVDAEAPAAGDEGRD